MGWRRKLIICLGACAGCVLLIALCVNYPAIDGFLRNFGRQDQGGTADYSTAEESLPVGNSGSGDGLPVPAPHQIPEGVGEISYTTPGLGGGLFEYTLHDVKIYDSAESAGVPVSECTTVYEEDETLQAQKFMVFDMSVKNLGEKPGPHDDPDAPFCLDMWVLYTEEGLSGNSGGAYECYFSEHPPQTPTSTNYYHFALEIGEEMDFQYGVSVPDELLKSQGFVLCLGSYENEHFFNPFDQRFTGVVTP